MKLLDGVLTWAFVLAHVVTLIVLGWRKWWKGAPAFMVFLAIASLQSVVGLFSGPHDDIWWRWVWAPIEAVVLLSATAAAIEVLFKRTSFGHSFERLALRTWSPVVAISLVKFEWHIGEHATWWGWFVYAREYVWIGLAVLCGLVVTFFATPSRDRKPEPITLVRHSQVYTFMLLSHSLVAPLARQGYDSESCRQIFMACMIACCAAWVTLCCPTASPSTFVPIRVVPCQGRHEKPSRA